MNYLIFLIAAFISFNITIEKKQGLPAVQFAVETNPDTSGIQLGYSNEEGNHILLLTGENGDIDNPRNYTHAIAASGKLIPLMYLGVKTADDEDNGRKTKYNFIHSGGHHYKTLEDKVDPDNAVFLVDGQKFKPEDLITLSQLDWGDMKPEIKTEIEAAKGRKVNSFMLLGVYDLLVFYLVEFEKKKDSALVSLALVYDGGISFIDYPAKYDEQSTWRVDDGGDFGMGYYHVAAMFRKSVGIWFAIEWIGAEGTVIELYQFQGTKISLLKSEYLYQAPF